MRRIAFPLIIMTVYGLLLSLLSSCTPDNPRTRTSFNIGWHFALIDDDGAYAPEYDDRRWRFIDLPHDWSIEGEFSNDHPATPGGGALPGGIGWYRKAFHIREADRNKLFYIEFDGVYRNSEVWINGHYLGKRPYGYSSFRYEITPWLKYGSEHNVVSVKVDNSKQPNSRWYSGSGIYRNVWLVSTGTLAVDHWGVYITTPEVSIENARVQVSVQVRNSSGNTQTFDLKTIIFSPSGKKVVTVTKKGLTVNDSLITVSQEAVVPAPLLWSDTDPKLYRAVTEIRSGSEITDICETKFGIRSFTFDADSGFILNGVKVKIRGVCNHHDLGCLGAAVYPRAIERQLELLKEMGCNAIRTSHNPPAPELLDLCDMMGFIVMDEAFDMWKKSKTRFDYSLDWDEWHRRDLEDLVRRDRNHPSVFIWSIGNEIIEQWDTSGLEMTRMLASYVRALDESRPVTAGCNYPWPDNSLIRSGALDLIGYNYHDSLYLRFPQTFPGQAFIASETNSALATRGSYDMPSDSLRIWPVRWDIPFREGNDDLSCSSYDNCRAPWGSSHTETWPLIENNDFLSGMFIWTGFDYLGEPTPYGWPARSSYFGLLDLAGFPKDAYYYYQSEWTDRPVLHLLPHWNWTPEDTVDVWAYTNCDEAELFINGRSLGMINKTPDIQHLMWRVPFEPGTLLAVGMKGGREAIRTLVKTAGEPAAILLSPDRTIINADGSDLSFITVTITDSENNPVPDADNLVTFTLEGNATIIGVDNGSQTSMESFRDSYRRAFNGKCLVVLKAGEIVNNVKIGAVSEGLMPATAEISIR